MYIFYSIIDELHVTPNKIQIVAFYHVTKLTRTTMMITIHDLLKLRCVFTFCILADFNVFYIDCLHPCPVFGPLLYVGKACEKAYRIIYFWNLTKRGLSFLETGHSNCYAIQQSFRILSSLIE